MQRNDSPLIKIEPPKLVSVTQMQEKMTAEEAIAYMARVSSPQNQDKHDTAYKLLKYCLVNGHWSVFDMVDLTLEIWTTRAIAHQLLRHWSFRVQEFSQRYSELAFIDWGHVEGRLKADGGNRQGSGESSSLLTHEIVQTCKASEASYHYLLQQGCSPETARMACTLATPTRLYLKGSVRTYITYFWQRASLHHIHAQKEHRDLADGAFEVFSTVFPNISKLVSEGMPVYLTAEEKALIEAHRKGKA